MAAAAGRTGGGGSEPSADSAGTRRPKAVRNTGVEIPESGFEPTRPYDQGIFSQLISFLFLLARILAVAQRTKRIRKTEATHMELRTRL